MGRCGFGQAGLPSLGGRSEDGCWGSGGGCEEMRSLAPGEGPLGAVAVGEVAEGDVLPEGEVVRAGEGQTGFDFFGQGAEVAVVEGDSVPAADDGGAGCGARRCSLVLRWPCGSCRRARSR